MLTSRYRAGNDADGVKSRGRILHMVLLLVALACIAVGTVAVTPAQAFHGRDTITSFEGLGRGEELTSQNGFYSLTFRSDGDLLLTQAVRTDLNPRCWSAGTTGLNGVEVVVNSFQSNLNMNNPRFGTVWSTPPGPATPPNTTASVFFKLQNDGNGVLFKTETSNSTGISRTFAVWSTNTRACGGVLPLPPVGTWTVAGDGGVFSYGQAPFLGSAGGIRLAKPIVAMAATRTGRGYWLVASDGGIFSYGDARFYGSLGGTTLNKPIVGIAPSPSGRGYWLVASDGGIFAFGDAAFYGSTGGISLQKPIVGMTPTPEGRGYWLVASDGGIFAYGDARFFGSGVNSGVGSPVIGIATVSDGSGYWLAYASGRVLPFGSATSFGEAPSNPTYVGIASSAYGSYTLATADGAVYTFTKGRPVVASFLSGPLSQPIKGLATAVG